LSQQQGELMARETRRPTQCAVAAGKSGCSQALCMRRAL
jgi:hypothetical protein